MAAASVALPPTDITLLRIAARSISASVLPGIATSSGSRGGSTTDTGKSCGVTRRPRAMIVACSTACSSATASIARRAASLR